MKISQNGINLIKSEEGCVLKVYLDVVGVKTLGYGHTGADVNALSVGTPITQDVADAWLVADLIRFENNVNKYNDIYHWTQNEFDALCDFAFNVGSIDQLTAKGTRTKEEIANKLLLYDSAKGKKLPVLTARRKKEQAMFLQGSYVQGYIIGKNYTLKENLYIRIAPQGDKIDYYSITSNAQLNAYTDDEGFSILRKGTRVTCKSIKTINDDIWIEIPSGWVCARKNSKIYIA